MERPLEVPYNFDKQLIDFMKIYNQDGELYHCIYTAPYWEDYKSAKYYYARNDAKDMNNNRNITRNVYNQHMEYIEQVFPNKLMLLLQQNTILMDEDLLKSYYIDQLHFTKFCVGSLEQAKVIKKINPYFEVVGSITMKVEPEDLIGNEEYKQYFDSFVLWFPYNRDINKVRSLPKWFEYILLVNCSCSIYCQGTHHWLAKSKDEDDNIICPKSNPELCTLDNLIYIRPMDLRFWNDNINYYKLQGREYETPGLIEDIILYGSNSFKPYSNKEQMFMPELYYKH